ncbi:hypothetical protein L3556_00895 [Candidatus Synechococcus calcipolaris G9]|uniref:Uncharacterized protein n=1 Tax=Candidatus Synechococcus calcipolaris G9 TaxID=1497997 RepID=A0ABT6EX63_9SYNE|nr:hypothetical protein [Candidatus Synechococcus calcipolaris]MDG2989495.1 hypothetical protein [Candidatus Synechococcus calcipolaris G9]
MNIDDSYEVIFEANTPWSENTVYSFGKIVKDIESNLNNNRYIKPSEMRVIQPDGTWKRARLKVTYKIKVEEISPEALVTPPPEEASDSYYDDSWPPPGV